MEDLDVIDMVPGPLFIPAELDWYWKDIHSHSSTTSPGRKAETVGHSRLLRNYPHSFEKFWGF